MKEDACGGDGTKLAILDIIRCGKDVDGDNKNHDLTRPSAPPFHPSWIKTAMNSLTAQIALLDTCTYCTQ